jgi:hypothetical protein
MGLGLFITITSAEDVNSSSKGSRTSRGGNQAGSCSGQIGLGQFDSIRLSSHRSGRIKSVRVGY